MSINAFTAAQRICQRSDWTVSHLKIQRVLYIAHMIYLGRKNKPLIDGYFESWDCGPINNDLYQKLSSFGSNPVGNVFRASKSINENSDECRVIDEAWDQLAIHPGETLVGATNGADGAWAKSYPDNVIPDSDIENEYNDIMRY